jgi:pimeloyl-ACP methyl ester carboxylesterase
VLIHAFPMDHTMWDAQVRDLEQRSYLILCPDLPGFAQSTESEGWRLADVAAAILGIATTEGIDALSVVGLSMGTYAAFEIYRQAPDRVLSLVVANGRARADNETERNARTQLIERVRTEGLDVLDEAMLPRLVRPGTNPTVAARIRQTMHRNTPEAIAHALEALRERADSTPLLAHIRCPTLVIAASDDPITTPADCRELAEAIPGAKFVEIPEAGHLSNLDNPVAFNDALGAFLDSIE